MKIKRFSILSSCLLIWLGTIGQELVNWDHHYVDNIATCNISLITRPVREQFTDNNYQMLQDIKYGKSNFQISYNTPILELGQLDLQRLVIVFDDLDGGSKNYYFYIEHCNSDWRLSSLQPEEYIEGQQEDQIYEFAFSALTKQDYTHYVFTIPNAYMTIKKSGNYLLHVIDEETDQPVLTRRIIVAESVIFEESDQLIVATNTPVQAQWANSHQNLQIKVGENIFSDSYNLRDIEVTVVQNGVWQNKITENPIYIEGEFMTFEPNRSFVFPGNDQFRHLDLSTVKGTTIDIDSIHVVDGEWHAWVKTDEIKQRRRIQELDYHGGYIVRNIDVQREEALESQYVLTHFTLQSPKPLASEVYVVGGYNLYQCNDHSRMDYYPEEGVYKKTVKLKQGIYNYMYAVKNVRGVIVFDVLQRNEFDTSNEYRIYVYYRPFGGRYDEVLIAANVDMNVFRLR